MPSSIAESPTAGDLLDSGAHPAFTIGYEGRSLSEFITLLRAHEVEQVIDVREIPLSRKRGFSKNALSAALERVGIDYVLIRALGSPSKIRADYRSSGDFRRFTQLYRRHLRASRPALKELKGHLMERPSAVLCFERDAAACHRSIVCEALAQTSISFTHL